MGGFYNLYLFLLEWTFTCLLPSDECVEVQVATPHLAVGAREKVVYVPFFFPKVQKKILHFELRLAPSILDKALWRILKWEYSCNYTFIHKFFFRVGDKVYILVTLESKLVVFGIFRCGNKNYMEIICLRNMKEIGGSNIRTENVTVRKHGRKWLHFFVPEMKDS